MEDILDYEKIVYSPNDSSRIPDPEAVERYLHILKESEVLKENYPQLAELSHKSLSFHVNLERSYAFNALLIAPIRYIWEEPRAVISAINLYYNYNLVADHALALGGTIREENKRFFHIDGGGGHSYSPKGYGRILSYSLIDYFKKVNALSKKRENWGEKGLFSSCFFNGFKMRVNWKYLKDHPSPEELFSNFSVEYRNKSEERSNEQE